MGWSKAYNFNLRRDVRIDEVMAIRHQFGRRDPRAGNLWCHDECFKKESGYQLTSRRESINSKTGELVKKAYFAKWPSKYESTDLFCGVERVALSKRESMDYGNFFIAFESYIQSLVGKKKPYYVGNFTKQELELEPDFEITHSEKIGGIIPSSIIYIIDENKRRKRKFPKTHIDDNTFVIILRISEYTVEQLNDFKIGGVEKFAIKWKHCLKLLEDAAKKQTADEQKYKQEKKEAEEKAFRDNERMRLSEKEASEHSDHISDLHDLLDQVMENYYDLIVKDLSYINFINKAEEYLSNKESMPVWHAIHTEIREEGMKLNSKLFYLRFSSELISRSGRNIVDISIDRSKLQIEAENHYDGGTIWLSDIFEDVFNFLREFNEGMIFNVYVPSPTLLEIANLRLWTWSQSISKSGNRILDLVGKMGDLQESNIIQFEEDYPYGAQIEEFFLRVKIRIRYYEAWLDKFYNTSYPSRLSKKNSTHAIEMARQSQNLLNEKSKHERMFDYHNSECKNSDEFTTMAANSEIFVDIEQCHRMLRITLSAWNSLSKENKLKLKMK
jgi:hypothetical protein